MRNVYELSSTTSNLFEQQNQVEAPCWRLLAQSLGMVLPSNGTKNAVMIFLNTCRKIPQAHRYIIIAFHPKVLGIVHLYFSKGRHGVKASIRDKVKLT
jgi:archaellum biogenesis ATPase FlaH